MNIKELMSHSEENMKKALESTRREFSEIRTGRASPTLVEGLHVEYYGSHLPLKQVASISAPDAHLIVIQPWDVTVLGEIEKKILASNLGINPANDGKVIRLAVPPLSKERREELVKVVHKMAEEGRVSLRTIRRDAIEAIRKLEKDSAITEDDRFRYQDEVQKITDKYIEKIDSLLKEKEEEIIKF
ncbi:MAG: ribosome recycling factor [Candidatus Omnitrophota bacterium]